jgi:plasmid stability protein
VANVTIALDDDLVRRARVKAVNEGTSINAVIRDFLDAWTSDNAARTAAVQRLRAAMEASTYDSGAAAWTREELHQR